MRIAIFTQPLHTNYGGILQAYALQTFLQARGHSVVVINRRYNFELTPGLLVLRIASFIKCVMRYCLLGQKEVLIMNPFSPFYHSKWSGYDVLPFVMKYINQSKAIFSSKQLREYLDLNTFDCYVVGSDQVWRPRYSPCITDFFLKEVPVDANTIKIAYAASFGTNQWELSEEQTKECAELAKKFNAVSVREDSGITLCKEYLGLNAEHLLDPTMLLEKEDYISLFEQARTPKSKGNLFCYVLDENAEANRIIASFEEEGYIPNYATLEVKSSKDNLRPYQLSVEEWLRGIYDSDVVITDSFHACVFSILFEKPFIVVGNISRGNARFDSLLRMFALSERYIDSYDLFLQYKGSLMDNANVLSAQNILKSYRQKSSVFIETHIV